MGTFRGKALDAAQLPYVHDPLAVILGKGTRPTTGADDDEDNETDGATEGGEGEQPGKNRQQPKKKGPTRFLVICGCIERDDDGKPKLGKDGREKPGRAIQISRKSWEFGTVDGGDEGGLMCGRCKQPFRKADPDAD
ncbi:hypothetical protein BJP40_00180 [Streptomyces sp. CC53]|uniref:hypothetical protein n=1 Tax=Streptomyces sp. CC53 TaxID=1906740 RepID=UPI0008DDC660|nr:hypothetical protein [Streptomyces sp. CC53]OII64320.1 hypothetical protein BJP40_00180 [Streptomyces sp. CC53]